MRARSVVAVSNDRAGGDALAAELGTGCVFAYADVRSEDDLSSMVDDVVARFGRLDCLVNNAGTHLAHRPIDAITAAEFRALLDLNLVSQFLACRSGAAPPPTYAGQHHQHGQPGGLHRPGERGGLRGDQGRDRRVHQGAGDRRGAAWRAREQRLTGQHRHAAVAVVRRCVSRIPTRCERTARRRSGSPGSGPRDEVGRLCVYLAAEATYTTGVDHVISGGAELGYGRKAFNGLTLNASDA